MRSYKLPYKNRGSGRPPRLAPKAYRSGRPVHVILCSKDRRPILGNPQLATRVFERLRAHSASLAGCVMPDHVHWLLKSADRIQARVGRLKSGTTRSFWELGHTGTLWQRSFYDRVVRREEDLHKVARYIVENPLRAGLAEQLEAYPFAEVWTERFDG